MVATKLLNTFNSHIYFYLKSVIAYWEGNFYGGSDLCNFLRMLALPRNNSETTTGYWLSIFYRNEPVLIKLTCKKM